METQKEGTGLILTGALIGAFFPVLAITSDMLYENLPFTWAQVAQLYSRGPLHWIILTAPIVLGLFSAYFRQRIRLREALWEEGQKKNEEQLGQFQSYVSDLEKGDFSTKEYSFNNEQLGNTLASLKE